MNRVDQKKAKPGTKIARRETFRFYDLNIHHLSNDLNKNTLPSFK